METLRLQLCWGYKRHYLFLFLLYTLLILFWVANGKTGIASESSYIKKTLKLREIAD